VREQKHHDQADEQHRVDERHADDESDLKPVTGAECGIAERREGGGKRELSRKVRTDENFEERDGPRRDRDARGSRFRGWGLGAGNTAR
jgi:hypothetical protein